MGVLTCGSCADDVDRWRKNVLLCIVAFHGMQGIFSAGQLSRLPDLHCGAYSCLAMLIPGYEYVSSEFGVSLGRVAYLTYVYNCAHFSISSHRHLQICANRVSWCNAYFMVCHSREDRSATSLPNLSAGVLGVRLRRRILSLLRDAHDDTGLPGHLHLAAPVYRCLYSR